MNLTNHRALKQPNSGGQKEAGFQSGESRRGLGGQHLDVTPMGAGPSQPARPCVEASGANPERRGGQHAGPGLFGLPLLKRAERAAAFQAEDKAPARHTLTVRLSTSPRLSAPAVTSAMQEAARAAEVRDERDWRELADLAVCPEWDRTLPYGSVEAALAQD